MSDAVSLRTPKYRHHKAKNLAVVTISGRDIYLGKFNSPESKHEYRRLVGEYMQTGVAPRGAAAPEISTIEVVAAYLKFAHGYYRKGGKVTREYGLIVECCRFIKSLYGRQPAIEFGPLALKAVRQTMIEADHSRKYINKNVERIRRMFKWAAGEELIPASVPQALSMVIGLRQGRSVARETAPVLPVDDNVVNQTLVHVPEVIGDMIRVQRLTGMRPQEICIMRPMDLDRSGALWTYRPVSHKTEHHGKERIIYIGPKAQAILLRYLSRATTASCFRPCDSEARRRAGQHANRKTPLSCGNVPGSNVKRRPKRSAGECYDAGSYRRAIHRACDLAFPHPELGKIKECELLPAQIAELRKWQSEHRWSPNRLRHSTATEIRRQFGLEAAQVILGHATADVTQIYATRDTQMGIEVAKKIG
jgi:integrase